MKRVGLLATTMGVLVSMGLLIAGQGYADENDRATKCTLDTLKGRYLFAGTGTLLPPAFGVKEPSVSTSAGYHIFNGDGTGTTISTESINGVITNADSHRDLSYTVNADCTGTVKVLGIGATQEIFVAPNGDDMTVIATGTGHVEAFSSWRVGAE